MSVCVCLCVLCSGLLLRLRLWEQLDTADLYSDRRYFVVHDEPEDGPETPPLPTGTPAQTSDPL